MVILIRAALVFVCSALSIAECVADDRWFKCTASHVLSMRSEFETRKIFYVFLNSDRKKSKVLSSNGDVECPTSTGTKIDIGITDQEYSIMFGRQHPKDPLTYPSVLCTLNIRRITREFDYSQIFFFNEGSVDNITHKGVCELLERPPNLAPGL